MWWWKTKWWLRDNRPQVLEWGWFSLLSVLLTWPMVLSPNSAALGSQHADGMKHLWTLWWMRASVWDYGSFPFNTDIVNYPIGMDLYPIEPLNGLFALLFPWMPLIMLANLLVLVNLTLTGVFGAWFGRLVSQSRIGGVVAGTLLQGSSVMAFFVHVGVGELHHLWWLPLGLGLQIKARDTMEWKWFLALACALVGAMLSCFYLGFFLAISVLAWALLTGWAGRRTPGLVGKYVVAAALAIAIVIPVTKSFSSSYKTGTVPDISLIDYVTQNHGQPVTDPPAARLELSQLVTPRREAKTRELQAYGGGRYLGILSLGFAFFGLIRDPKKALPWVVIAGIGILFAFGTYWTVDGIEVRNSNNIRLVMPLFWLNRALGYLAEPLNFPTRFLAVTAVAISAMAALAVKEKKLLPLVFLAVVEISWGSMTGYPWQRLVPREASVLSALDTAEEGSVIDLSLAVRSDMENRFNALGTQIVHNRKVHAVPVERVEYFAREGQVFVQATKLFHDLKPFYENRGGELSGSYRGDLAVFQDAGFKWIVVSYRNGAERMPQGIITALTQICGPAIGINKGVGAWRLPDVQYTEEELKIWKSQHALMQQSLSLKQPGMGPPPSMPNP